MDLNPIIEFFHLTRRLKLEPRKGWIVKAGIRDPESVADHIFRTALLGLFFGEMKGLDTCRIMKMALLHDLAEALTGDLLPQEKKGDHGPENRAFYEMIRNIPREIRVDFESTWEEWLLQGSEEAKLVHQLDKLEMCLQAKEYMEDGYDKRTLKGFINKAKTEIKDKVVLQCLGKVRAAR